MQGRACVFVDGENFRHSLCDLFARETNFREEHYLPVDADWTGFFDWIVKQATDGECRRLRTYWYVVGSVDYRPANADSYKLPAQRKELKEYLSRNRALRPRLQGVLDHELDAMLATILPELRAEKHSFQTRFDGWRRKQDGIARKQRAVEFRRAGAITYDLAERTLGKEKAVDVQLACDLLMLRNIYDTAIILSGDQDYVPAAQVLKDSGKTVINVAFAKRNGDLLPGGAMRLTMATDSSLSVPYKVLLNYMRLEEKKKGKPPVAAVKGAS